MATELERLLFTLKHGDHVCPIYDCVAEQMAAIVSFFREGLASNECCVYVADEQPSNEVLQALQTAGIDPGLEQGRGRLRILTKRDAYLLPGAFDPGAMIEFLRLLESQTLADGFAGLRFTGEMTWALGPEEGNHRLIEYEALLTEYLHNSRSILMCQYHRVRFSPSVIHDVLRTHPLVVLDGHVCPNPFYESPQMILGQVSEADRVNWRISQLAQARLADQAKQTVQEERDRLLARLRLQIDRLPLAYILMDAHHRILDWNPAAEKIFGYVREEALGTSLL